MSKQASGFVAMCGDMTAEAILQAGSSFPIAKGTKSTSRGQGGTSGMTDLIAKVCQNNPPFGG
jgi:hypothetical protein